MKMYHVHKKNYEKETWDIGKTIRFEEDNDFWKLCKTYKAPVCNFEEEKLGLNDMLNISIDTMNVAKSAIHEYLLLIRELGLEEVRKEKYNNLPSRQKCIWLCRKNQIEYWKKQTNGECDIYEIEIDISNNILFKSRDSLLPKLGDKYEEILEKSNEYWNYNKEDENEDDEYLYCGEITILNKIKL